jgi:phosphoribosylamine--glycine ligase/phosphoribosylglycinamide formyltransferase/phosphoribosylformylglycinamidine cyclo-ligase/phosphoribosylamine--glycine ligase/phosphoribosylformylglycinamidine cyclo-ligase
LLRLSTPRQIYVAPGNAGTQQLSPPQILNVPELKPNDVEGIVAFARKEAIDLIVVGPEDPLVRGLGDQLREAHIPCFGPSAAAARLEGSKAWAKAFMQRHHIPTAAHATFSDLATAQAYVQQHRLPLVVKASGLAGGKGVTVAITHAEALAALEAIMGPAAVFGVEAGREVVVEECLMGEEVSVMALCDGDGVVACLPCARDFKRLLDDDEGPNTGGMGSIAPVPGLTPAVEEKMRAILQQVAEGMKEEGHPYYGVLYGGFMLTRKEGGKAGEEEEEREPKVLEFNCRFGDPETQSLLPLLPSNLDLAALMLQCVQGASSEEGGAGVTADAASEGFAVTVIAASEGYPTATGAVNAHIIHGLPMAARVPGVHSVVHAGTARKVLANGARVMTVSGGRVLGVTSKASTLRLAILQAYHGLSEIRFQGMQYRTDIGAQAVRSAGVPVRVAVLGSTKGTSVLPLLKGKPGQFEVVLALSDTELEGGLLANARAAGVPDCRFVGGEGEGEGEKEAMEEKIEVALEEAGAEILLLNGYNRILSPRLVRVLRGRCLNVHPSLLPDFGGHFDLAVHQAVLDAGRTRSGCTIHFVTDDVDQGPVLVQKTCLVAPGSDTAATLKAKVQALETAAWEEALRLYQEDLPRVTQTIMAMGVQR